MHSDPLKVLISPAFSDEVLLNMVRKKTGWKDVTINKLVLDNSVTKKGDSYLSTVTRFKIEASGKLEGDTKEASTTVAVITKAIPKNVARRKTYRCNDFFANEIQFYEEVWETLRKFLISKKLKTKLEDIIPLYLASASDGENDFIALEDACYNGYDGIDRSSGLNLAHTKLIINCFAQFHAISFAYKHQHPEDFERIASTLTETYFHDRLRGWYVPFQKKLIATLRDCVEKQLPASYVKRYDEVTSGDFYGVMTNLCAKQTPLSVITHGDAWVPNFLMKYDDQKNPVVPLMIDFQLARCSSLGLDLTFFLYTCVEQDILVKYWDSLLEEYHRTFQSNLKDLGTDPNLVKLEDIKTEVKAAGVYGVGMSMEGLVMSLIDEDEVADIDNIQGDVAVPLDTVWVLHPFKDEAKRQRVADMIKHAVDNDFI